MNCAADSVRNDQYYQEGQHRVDDKRREQQRQDERALEQFEKRASEYNADLIIRQKLSIIQRQIS